MPARSSSAGSCRASCARTRTGQARRLGGMEALRRWGGDRGPGAGRGTQVIQNWPHELS